MCLQLHTRGIGEDPGSSQHSGVVESDNESLGDHPDPEIQSTDSEPEPPDPPVPVPAKRSRTQAGSSSMFAESSVFVEGGFWIVKRNHPVLILDLPGMGGRPH